MKYKTLGFTLIEVLVALVILAIALVGVMLTIGGSARMSGRVRDDVAAHFVAMNVLAKMQSNMMAPRDDKDSSSGESQMMGRHWFWQASVEQADKTANQVKVVVARQENGPSIVSLTGFVRRLVHDEQQ